MEKKKKKEGWGGVGTVFAHAMLLVVLPTFQLVTKLTEEKNKRRVFCIPFEYPANIILCLILGFVVGFRLQHFVCVRFTLS